MQAISIVTTKSFNAAFQELLILADETASDSGGVNRALKIVERLDKCLIVKPEDTPTAFAGEPDRILQPSDLFMRYVAAFRARDWPLVGVIEHEICS
jgi:hypothetical protein